MTTSKKIKVRFAPSPTGFLHIGGLRTALFNYLFAKKNKGEFLLRLEDTDRARFVEGAEKQITDTLETYGIAPDNIGEIWRQSDHLATYKKHADKLLAGGNAYECFCTQDRLEKLRQEQTESKQPTKYDRHCLTLSPEEREKLKQQGTVPVIRMKVPVGVTVHEDIVYGKIETRNELLDDQVLLKSDGYPTYHLANVVDDHTAAITHVIRGEEWVPSTPKHLILYQMFGWKSPLFAHLPLIVKPDHKKLSKRDKAADVLLYRDFFEIEAVLNYIALLGWNPKTKQEIFSKEELASEFELAKINRANAIFDLQKLNWLNREWVKRKDIENSQFFATLKKIVTDKFGEVDKNYLPKIAPLILERIEDFWTIGETVEQEFGFLFKTPEYDAALLLWKKMKAEQLKNSLNESQSIIKKLTGTETREDIQKIFYDAIGQGDKGSILWPLRAALSGLKASPGPFEIIEVLSTLPNGKETILTRLQNALDKSANL